MPTSADLLLDTSAAIALVRDADPAHESVVNLTRGLTLGLAGHAVSCDRRAEATYRRLGVDTRLV